MTETSEGVPAADLDELNTFLNTPPTTTVITNKYPNGEDYWRAAPGDLSIKLDPTWGITGSLLEGFEGSVYRFIPGFTRGEGLFMAVLRKSGVSISPPESGGARGGLNIYKIAAAFIGLLMLSGITYAAVHVISNIESKPKVAITDRKPDVKKVKKTYDMETAPTKEAPVIYNNVELEQIMQHIADGYGVKVEFRNEAARTLRFYLQWEADDTLQEIIDKINHFEKVHLTLTDETITIE